ncbi:methionine ABC transporter ATP-binding protein [Megasphaera hexanoica]|uniref:Methionine ABC transporter ATP-binding protein n=1 Tax=Megasphaera hexanoica TaxID=1675036 RepID=A0ABW7DKH5_9FIRM|nr:MULTISPECIES: methionine ABC transporter ATP-binding protein [Megasphaera]AXB82532.1 methionine ABC transporter ATP-binding protein [Megasphaera hexanoica]KUH55625.1 methionine ABC transporter ATP-binding protein [Megasphaera sp. DJF_B143]
MITFENITKTYGGKTHVQALKGISLTIHDGEIFGIIGKSGAGKSTLVRCINMLEKPTTGKVIIDDKELTAMSDSQLRAERKNIGMIFQHFNLLSSRTVFDNIAFPLELAGASKEVIRSKVDSLLELVGLTDRQFNYPSQLSGGQKQRVGIARALASDPKILLCDEATSALDPQTTKSILELLKDINKRLGITIVIITHEMAVIKEICDRVAVIEGGVIKEQGRVIDVFTNPQSETMKEFVKSVINMELPEGIKKLGVTNQPSPDRDMLVRFRFKGAATNEPLVVNVARKFNLDVSVLYGNIDYIQDVPFGYLIVVIMGDMKAQTEAYSYIKTQPIESEVLGYVPRTH